VSPIVQIRATCYYWHMPRKKQCRQVHGEPGAWFFKPQGIPLRELKVIELGMDEFEAVRLADGQGMYHAQAAAAMGVSRQTFGLIVNQARHKIAQALSSGQALRINPEFLGEGELPCA
jgi:uncharacterized protein